MLTDAITSIPAIPLLSLNQNPKEAQKNADNNTSVQKSTKRKRIPEATTVVTEPVSKQVHTKTMHAIASEEQSAVQKQHNSGKNVMETQAGKENGTPCSRKAKQG